MLVFEETDKGRNVALFIQDDAAGNLSETDEYKEAIRVIESAQALVSID